MLGVAIPLYNEAARLPQVVGAVVRALSAAPLPFRLALVNNGSTDATGAAIEALAGLDPRLLALHLSANAGYGGGICAGVEALLQDEAITHVGWTWGDGQVDPVVFLPLIDALLHQGARLAKARRVRREDGLERLFVTRVYGLCTRGLGIATPDVNGCPKLMDRAAYQELAPRHRAWFLDAEVVIGAEARGWRIVDAPCTMGPRLAGRSKVRPSTALAFLRDLARWRLTGQP